MSLLRHPRMIDAVLLLAILIDVGLVVRTVVDPGWWFAELHGHREATAGELAFLYRCAAHWSAFALFQLAGLVGWRRWAPWLLIVAGVRFSDVFTDWTYLATSEQVTGLGAAGLALPGLLNWAMALFLVWAWHQQAARG